MPLLASPDLPATRAQFPWETGAEAVIYQCPAAAEDEGKVTGMECVLAQTETKHGTRGHAGQAAMQPHWAQPLQTGA